MDSFRKSVSFCELEDRESSAEENPLRDMFASSSSRVLNQVELEYEEPHPSSHWKLPAIFTSEVYNDLSVFHLKAATRITIKETISQIQENSNNIQSIPLLDPKYL